MTKWLPCGEHFITGDVIRCHLPAWKPKARKSGKVVKIGEHFIEAEVLSIDDGMAQMLVKSCVTTNSKEWWKPIEPFKRDEILRRRVSTIGQGGAERLLWSDESARALVVSKFMGHAPCDGQPRPGASPRAGSTSVQAQSQYSDGETAPRRRTYSRSRKKGPARRPPAR